VSVVVPTRDRTDLLPRVVGSILRQRYPGPVDVVLVLDAPPDGRALPLPRGGKVRVMENGRTPGPAGARNTGVLAAKGQLVAFCDDDDEWAPGKLRAQVLALAAHPEARVATCGIELITGRRAIRRIPRDELVTLDDLTRSRRAEVHTSTLLVRREALASGIGLLDESIPGSYGEDYDWLLRAAAHGPLVAVRRPLVRVRWDRSSFAEDWEAIVNGIRHQLARRPELRERPTNLARLYGRVAFGSAALGRRGEARSWARRSIATDWRQPRGYLAYAVSLGLLRPRTIVRLAHAAGRGV
jgi:glycosyltransferase involved in cell wall biosynthesis